MENKKIIFEVTHPKHFHQFKNLARLYREKNDILFLARDKDVVISLLDESEFNYETFDFFGKSISSKLVVIPRILRKYRSVFSSFNPDIVISRSSPYSTLLSKVMRFKSIIFPDSEIVKLTRFFVAPLADLIIVPKTFELKYNKKQHYLSGFFEESYLAPLNFKPNSSFLSDLGLHENEKFFVLRFVGWNANHDVNQFGFSLEEKIDLVRKLERYGRVLISSETKIEPELEQYRFTLAPYKMHSVLYYADLYAGDSQSMATESALLGTPSFRYNSFVGENDMSNFRVLENQYDMLRNFKIVSDLIEESIDSVKQNSKNDWSLKRSNYFENRKDLNLETFKLINSIMRF